MNAKEVVLEASEGPHQVEEVAIGSLRLDPANPRRISDHQLDALCESIRKYGLVQPILARREDRTVIGGHQRLVAARRLGFKAVSVIWLDLSLEKARLLNLALNRIAGEWDEEMLARLLGELSQDADVDLGLTGFEEQELESLLGLLERRQKREQVEDFDFAASLERARLGGRVRSGELWTLGRHRLVCGDAGKAGDLELLMAGEQAQLAVTDPPYNVSLGEHGGQQTNQRRRGLQNDNLPAAEWETFVRDWARNLLKSVDGAVYVFMSSKEWPLVARVLEEEGGHWSDTLIWAKDRFVLGRADYQRQYEPIWYGWREGGAHYWKGDRDQGDVWNIPRPATSKLHPTMKPLEILERAVENSCQPGDLVLDLFLGSGSTLIACERTGRTCVGLELDPIFAAALIDRWESFTKATAVRIKGERA